ncbi:MAG: methylated-DNA-[protein]-cysteine S-methyltransferase [Gaiellales bacterium]|nr:methylated-DNA-[protein]-cysteine S-methyltransferase [Gaiellales bacterium]
MFHSPAGALVLEGDDDALTRLGFGTPESAQGDARAVAEAAVQLEQYFAGERTAFDLDLRLEGTPFERRVWDEVRAIPYGETATYAEIARRVGSPSACRAVGRANGRNPIAVIVPCHRVVGSDGSLTGYAGGIEMKRALLELEQGAVVEPTVSVGRLEGFAQHA